MALLHISRAYRLCGILSFYLDNDFQDFIGRKQDPIHPSSSIPKKNVVYTRDKDEWAKSFPYINGIGSQKWLHRKKLQFKKGLIAK